MVLGRVLGPLILLGAPIGLAVGLGRAHLPALLAGFIGAQLPGGESFCPRRRSPLHALPLWRFSVHERETVDSH